MNVLVLAGGSDQIALIQELKKRNNYVILIDYFDNPVAKKYADKHIKASTLDKELVLEIAQEEKAGLVITTCTDQAILTMAYVSEKLGLKCYLTYEQAINFTNKMYMKELMIKNGIPTSKYKIVNSFDCFTLDEIKFPLVVKPVDNNSSKGILKVYKTSELKNAVTDALKYSRSGNVIVEEFKQGIEYSIDAFIQRGKAIIIIVTQYKKISNGDKFTIVQSSYPCYLSSTVMNKIEKLIVDIGKTFEVDNIPLFIQLLVDNDDINVVEFSARTGGGSKHYFIRELTGVNIIQNLLDITYGKKPDLKIKMKNKYASICFVYAKAGVFCGIKNIEELKKQKIVHDYYCYKSIGMEITKAEYSSDRPAGFFVIANSETELKSKINFIDENIQVLNEKGEDIMIHGLYTN